MDGVKLSALLQRRLDGALQHSNRLVDNGPGLGIAAPSLTDSVRRAAAYYGRVGDEKRKRDAEHLLEHLTQAK